MPKPLLNKSSNEYAAVLPLAGARLAHEMLAGKLHRRGKKALAVNA